MPTPRQKKQKDAVREALVVVTDEERKETAARILATVESNDQGVSLVYAAKIAHTTEVREWMKDPAYAARVDELREERRGDLSTALRNLAASSAVDAMNELIAIATGTKAGTKYQIPAIVELLERAGIDPKAVPKRRDLLVLIQQRIVEGKPSEAMEVSIVEPGEHNRG